MRALAHLVYRRRWVVIGIWIVLTAFGVFSASQVSKRWFESFSIPGYSAYEANQRTIKAFGSGENPPLVAVVTGKGRIVDAPGVKQAIAAAVAANPGARSSSYFTTGSDVYVSKDGHTTFAEIFRPGESGFGSDSGVSDTQRALSASAPPGVKAYVTGRDAIESAAAKGNNNGPSVLGETLIGGFGALIILLFVFGTLPAVAMPLLTAVASILNTFTLVWVLTYITDVSIIVQFLIALVGLGVSIDYALLMIFRFREELRHGESTEDAIVTTMQHAGRSVIVSGSTVAVGLAEHGAAAAAVHPLDRDRRHADPRRLGARVDHAAAGDALAARPADQPRARDAEAASSRAATTRAASGPGGRGSSRRRAALTAAIGLADRRGAARARACS